MISCCKEKKSVAADMAVLYESAGSYCGRYQPGDEGNQILPVLDSERSPIFTTLSGTTVPACRAHLGRRPNCPVTFARDAGFDSVAAGWSGMSDVEQEG